MAASNSTTLLEGVTNVPGQRGAELKQGMSVIDIIKMEHAGVMQLWQEYQTATAGEIKEAKAHLIINQVVQHSGKEESVLYPVLKELLDDGVAQMERAKQEHQQATEDLYKLDQMNWAKFPNDFNALLSKIMTELSTHIVEEESVILPQLAAKVDQQRLIDLGQKFQSAMVTTRPHPWAPREGVAAAMAHAASVPLDKARDAARFDAQEVAAAQGIPTKNDLVGQIDVAKESRAFTGESR